MAYLKPGDKVKLTPYGLNLAQQLFPDINSETIYTLNAKISEGLFYITINGLDYLNIELEEDPYSEYNLVEKVSDKTFENKSNLAIKSNLTLKPKVTVDFYKDYETVILLYLNREIKFKTFSEVTDNEHAYCFIFKYTEDNINQLNSLFKLEIPKYTSPSEIIKKLFETQEIVLVRDKKTSELKGITKYPEFYSDLIPIDSITGNEILFL